MPVPRLCSKVQITRFLSDLKYSKVAPKVARKTKNSAPKNTPPGDALLQPVILAFCVLKLFFLQYSRLVKSWIIRCCDDEQRAVPYRYDRIVLVFKRNPESLFSRTVLVRYSHS